MKFLKRLKKVKVKEEPKPQGTHCLNCLSTDFYQGPSGGGSINVKCAKCGLWYNHSVFGLEFLGIKTHIGEHKRIVWYCTKCGSAYIKMDLSHYKAEYPTCCDTPLKVCWSYKSFPEEYCNSCGERFLCYTERNNA